MMIGEYPCCGGALWLPMPERTPAYEKEACPHCGVTVWHRYSRLDPQSYTEDVFMAEFVIDEATKTIRRRETMH